MSVVGVMLHEGKAWAVMLAILTAGCIQAVPPTETPPGPVNESDLSASSNETDPRTSDALKATEPGVTAPGLPPTWWSLSVEANSLGSVSSFAWSVPAEAVDGEFVPLDFVPQAVGNISAWNLLLVPDHGEGMDPWVIHREGPYMSVHSPLVPPRKTTEQEAQFVPFQWSVAPEIWQPDGVVWFLVTATGDGRLDLSFRVRPDTEAPILSYERAQKDVLTDFAERGPGTVLAAFASAVGAKVDWFVQGGTLANAPTPSGGYTRTSWTPGVTLTGFTDLATPLVQTGPLQLEWAAPWAKWSRLSFAVHDNVGAKAVSYELTSGNRAMEGLMVARGNNFVSVPRTADGALGGDGDGADAHMAFAMASGGDYMHTSFTAVALGATLLELTGTAAAEVYETPPLTGT